MLDTSVQIARTQKESLRKALRLISLLPAVIMVIFIPISIILRPEWNDLSTALMFACLILGATRLYVWITKQALSNVYLFFNIFVLVTFGALGFYGYGPTTAAIPSTFSAVVAGNLILKRKRDRRLLTASTCLILISVGSYNAQGSITIAPPEAWYSLIFGDHQRYLVLAASLAGIYLMYRLIRPFRVATSQIEALLTKDAKEVSQAEVSAELVQEMYRNIPGITIELDDADRVVMLSREAEACLKLSDNSALGHYSETRLISVSDIDLMIHGTDTSKLKTSVTVDTPWSDSPQRLDVSSILGPSQARHTILTFSPVNQINQKLGQFITQQLQELVTIGDDEELHLAVFSLEIYSAKSIRRMLNDIQRIANAIETELPLVCEATHADNLLCAVVSADRTSIAHAIELMRELHEVALTQNLRAAAGYFTDKLGSEDLESFISKSQIAIEIARESTDSSFIEYNQEMYSNWDPSVRASMVHAIKNEEITLQPHEIQKSKPTLPNLVDLRLDWHSAITERQPKHLSLYTWLAAYDLIKEHPINHPQHAVLRSTEFLTQSLDTSLIYTLPDQVVLDLTQFQRVLDAMSENDQFANRIIVAIREEAAAKFSLEHWRIARQMQTHGARFALSDIGTGDSDLSLLVNELFDFLSISAELTELAFTSEKNTVVLKNLLNLAQTLGKPSIVYTEPEHTNELKTLGADYISPI